MAIERQTIVELLRQAPEEGLQAAEVTQQLGLPRDQRPHVRRVLKRLAQIGVLEQTGRLFRLGPQADEPDPSAMGLLRMSPQGHGWVTPDDVTAPPIVIEAYDIGAAIDGDRVEVQVFEGTARKSRGRVKAVTERGRRCVTGELSGPPWRLEVDDHRLVRRVKLAEGENRLLKAGQIVVAQISRYPENAQDPLIVEVTATLGEPEMLQTEVARVLAEKGLKPQFSSEGEQQATAVPDRVLPSEVAGRVDLRDKAFVTIDPDTARDFDDAVAVEPNADGSWRVWVAVADVSHYVPVGSPLDLEAYDRAFSVYLPGRVIPMLPEPLSANICSLVPEQDRLAMVVRIDIDAHGEQTDAECMAAVIHSRARLDYEGVALAFAGKATGRLAHYAPHLPALQALRDVARALRTRRMRRGSLDLDLPEPKVVLDEDDPTRVRNIVVSRSSAPVREAYNLIEELMLAANEAVASMLEQKNRPCIWRIHTPPATEDLKKLSAVLQAYGIDADVNDLPQGKGLASLLQKLKKHPAQRPLTYLLLRSLKQAVYADENRGHYGLASPAYVHFTSPIRRYPDLVVHRVVKSMIGFHDADAAIDEKTLAPAKTKQIAEHTSERERFAIDVSRRVHATYAAHLMRDRLGDSYWGTVVAIVAFGAFVTLDEPVVDGLVRIDDLPYRVRFEREAHRFYGRRAGWTMSLGDRVEVRIIRSSVRDRQIDFELLDHEPARSAKRQ